MSTIDQEYYEIARPGSAAEFVMRKAREQIYADFLRLVAPTAGSKILDIGVSDVHSEGANWFEVKYPHKSDISACGLGTAIGFKAAFPEISYKQIVADQPLPYVDDEFDVAISNAVLEHVGSPKSQAFFIGEMIRVARRVFITVPHRFFPIEHHTGIPLLHYSDRLFDIACRALGKEKWADPKNLILLSSARLRKLAPQGGKIGYTGLKLGPFSSNLFLSYDKTR